MLGGSDALLVALLAHDDVVFCLVQQALIRQVLPGSSDGGARTAECLWIVLVSMVVVRSPTRGVTIPRSLYISLDSVDAMHAPMERVF
jgi:hypothetical protein